MVPTAASTLQAKLGSSSLLPYMSAAAANNLNRVAVGANDTVLKADSGQTEGVIWEKVVHSELTSIGTGDHHVEDHDHDGSPTQTLLAANTHGSPSLLSFFE